MIVAALKDLAGRPGLEPGINKALDWLRRGDPAALADGKYEIDGEKLFALVQRYTTAAAPEAPKFEAHRKYIDVQFIAQGMEAIGCAPLPLLTVTEAYNEEKDFCFGTVVAGDWSSLILAAGELAIFYPADAHAPKLAAGAACAVTKIVVKVAV
ncbi:MAG TPA: YhcH/YjgK/YiaL family protein [Elusimicrobiales bacterium]|nr:YhcH/YjgK/YiaL family protein [Elusimicrobiales bacterium]